MQARQTEWCLVRTSRVFLCVSLSHGHLNPLLLMVCRGLGGLMLVYKRVTSLADPGIYFITLPLTFRGVGDLVLVYKRVTSLAGHTSRVAELLEQVQRLSAGNPDDTTRSLCAPLSSIIWLCCVTEPNVLMAHLSVSCLCADNRNLSSTDLIAHINQPYVCAQTTATCHRPT